MHPVASRLLLALAALSALGLMGCPKSTPVVTPSPVPPAASGTTTAGGATVPGGKDSDALGPRAAGEMGNEQPPK